MRQGILEEDLRPGVAGVFHVHAENRLFVNLF
jgi:hypothetical protein